VEDGWGDVVSEMENEITKREEKEEMMRDVITMLVSSLADVKRGVEDVKKMKMKVENRLDDDEGEDDVKEEEVDDDGDNGVDIEDLINQKLLLLSHPSPSSHPPPHPLPISSPPSSSPSSSSSKDMGLRLALIEEKVHMLEEEGMRRVVTSSEALLSLSLPLNPTRRRRMRRDDVDEDEDDDQEDNEEDNEEEMIEYWKEWVEMRVRAEAIKSTLHSSLIPSLSLFLHSPSSSSSSSTSSSTSTSLRQRRMGGKIQEVKEVVVKVEEWADYWLNEDPPPLLHHFHHNNNHSISHKMRQKSGGDDDDDEMVRKMMKMKKGDEDDEKEDIKNNNANITQSSFKVEEMKRMMRMEGRIVIDLI